MGDKHMEGGRGLKHLALPRNKPTGGSRVQARLRGRGTGGVGLVLSGGGEPAGPERMGRQMLGDEGRLCPRMNTCFPEEKENRKERQGEANPSGRQWSLHLGGSTP